MLIQKLGEKAAQFAERDKIVYAKIVDAYSKHDTALFHSLADELAEIRRIEWTMIHARLVLEDVIRRKCTVCTGSVGDILAWPLVTVQVLSEVRKGVVTFFPEFNAEFENIEDLLSGIIVETGIRFGLNIDFQELSGYAQKILDEAADATQHKVKEEFQGFRLHV